MKKTEIAEVISNINITEQIYDMVLSCPQISALAKAGQFVEVYTGSGEYLLPRPISICEIGKDTLRLVYRVVGKGTDIFARLKRGDNVRLLGPCGNGFDIKKDKTVLLVGGGIGVPPLLEIAKVLKGVKVTAVLAARSEELSILSDDFKATGAQVHITTDDGSTGFKGNALELIKAEGLSADVIYACGPKLMLRFLAQYAEQQGIPCQVSMEERMACGIGACVGCVIKIKDGNGWQHKKVCKDGPVFDSREVLWQ